jgi:hypothetical protein
MFYDLGYEVERLKRTRIGSIHDEGMPPAAYRHLTPRELLSLKSKQAPKSEPPRKPASARPRKPAARPARKRTESHRQKSSA